MVLLKPLVINQSQNYAYRTYLVRLISLSSGRREIADIYRGAVNLGTGLGKPSWMVVSRDEPSVCVTFDNLLRYAETA